MRKAYALAPVLGALMLVVSLAPVYGEDQNLLEKIQELETKISMKDAIIIEQLKVIQQLSENYSPSYDPFSMEDYPTTGGFNPEWLEGEKDKIQETCQQAIKMGHTPGYCQFVNS